MVFPTVLKEENNFVKFMSKYKAQPRLTSTGLRKKILSFLLHKNQEIRKLIEKKKIVGLDRLKLH